MSTNTNGLSVCPACGYITADAEAACLRCGGPMPAREAEPAPWSPDTYGDSRRPPLPHERGGASYYPPPPPSRPRPVAVIVVAVLSVAVLFGLGALIAIPKIAARVSEAVDGERDKRALKSALDLQPDFTAAYEGVEGSLTYSGRVSRLGRHLALEMDCPRSSVTNDPRRSGMTKIVLIIRENEPARVVVPDLQRYVEIPAGTKDFPENFYSSLSRIVDEPACQAHVRGTDLVAGIECTVYELSASNRPAGATVWVAKSFNNLVMRMDLDDRWTNFAGPLHFALSAPQLGSTEDMFRVPVTYTLAPPPRE